MVIVEPSGWSLSHRASIRNNANPPKSETAVVDDGAGMWVRECHGRNTVGTMRSRIRSWWIAACLLLLVAGAGAQEDSPSLGDVARNLRKSREQKLLQKQTQPAAVPESLTPMLPAPVVNRTLIDNDNLTQVMEDAKKARPADASKTVLSLNSSGNALRLSSPDATCSLSFNARAGSLMIKPILIEDLPLDQLVKLDGPGSIEDENLQLELFNGTDWDLREVTVGLTLERKPGYNAEMAAQARVLPAGAVGAVPSVERHSDVTLLYHLKTEAKAFTTATLRENIGITPGADEDWRWSIVEAKGIRPSGASRAPESLSAPLYGSGTETVPLTNSPVENSTPKPQR